MKITKNGNNLVINDIDVVDLIRILKVNIPLKLCFIKNNKIEQTETIEIFSRMKIDKNSTINISSREQKNQLTSYNTVLDYVSIRGTLGYQVLVIFEINKLTYGQGELIKLLPKLKESIVNGCAYITFEENPNRYEIHYLNINGSEPKKLIFYVDNNSMLVFTESNPMLVTDNPKLSSIVDFLCG